MRRLLLAALAPATVAAVVWAYLVAIPGQFLIEHDTAPETGDWRAACSVPDASTVGLPTGVTLALERAGETWVRTGAKAEYGVLSMPGCAVARRELFFPGARGGIGYVTAGGAAWYRLDPDGGGAFQHRLSTSVNPDPVILRPPPGADYWSPILDVRAEAMAWIETQRGDDRAIVGHSIAVRALADGRTFRIALPLGPYSSPRLLDFNDRDGRFVVQRNYREILTVGLDGRPLGEAIAPAGFESPGGNIRLLQGGWVAWDGYRENARHRVAWSLPQGKGLYEIPKGRGVTAVSVDPAGRYIAVSVTGNLSIGSVRDAVFVVRVADGAEVWRRYLTRYARSQVAFLGAGYLAVTFVKDGTARIDVLEVPAQ